MTTRNSQPVRGAIQLRTQVISRQGITQRQASLSQIGAKTPARATSKPFSGRFPGSKIVHVNDTSACVRNQLVNSIQHRNEYVNMTAKKASDEIYDHRYAFMRFAKGMNQLPGAEEGIYNQTTGPIFAGMDMATSRTFFQKSIEQADLATPEKTWRKVDQVRGSFAGASSVKSALRGRNTISELTNGNTVVP